MPANEPLRERVRDPKTNRTHEVLARDAEVVSASPFQNGAKAVVIRCMLTARVRVIPTHEIDVRFVPVDPSEPVSRSKLHVVSKSEDDRHG
ncbi:hypothetical protein [Methylorubrum sp. GM97]|uniref:hypothetical protein n=1 Tax=Methylorubrum sp. GM97 TaxID=2938232 RepID=UPI002189E2C1|nr:hypothetical protein [Methylorubrum sp. GM97]BDL41077.1 hypothetical protein MSPGM_36670 [Methylorubrum sp. GM97]